MAEPTGPVATKGRREFRRVQRPTDQLPVLHLEAEIPAPKHWFVEISGLVEVSSVWGLDEIRSLEAERRVWDLHCVWGWCRPACLWEGVPAARLIDVARPRAEARFAVASAIEGPYASCLTLQEARESLLAWRMDGQELSPDHGGPLRLVPPPTKWGYKGIKWIGSITLTDHFSPGFWEELVGNVHGDIPPEMLELQFE
ncbi:MAG: molybdopterin-dependent oxidoreductase [Actinomycetota bacterium]